MATKPTDELMLDFVKRLERWITLALLAMLGVVVTLATIELGVVIARDIAEPPVLLPGIDKLTDIFSRFLLVLIGVELIETMRTFARGGAVRVEVVLTVATIAIARRLVVLEVDHVASLSLIGLAALLASLAFAYIAFVRGAAPVFGGRFRSEEAPATRGPEGQPPGS